MVREIDISEVKDIVSVFKNSTGIDFSNYAPSSLTRRFLRFMEIKNIWDVRELISLTRKDSQFAQEFINEVTVNVTEMFRDPDFWVGIKKQVLPQLQEKDEINIWHAACSSGEEVISMAILLEDAGLLDKTSILATDINQSALDIARLSMIPEKKQSVCESNYKSIGGEKPLANYYKCEDKHMIFNSNLQKNVVYKKHDLVIGGKPGSYDIIICRNVFIYFDKYLQEKVLNLFESSLTENGFLGIGAKESIAWCRSASRFQTVCADEKIFRKKVVETNCK